MHRYNDQTIAKVRTDYIHVLQRKYEAEIERLQLVLDSEQYTAKDRTTAKKKIDKISGTNFKPVKVFIDGIDEYEIGQMSDYKHLVIKPNDYLQIIKWNFNGSFDDMEEHSLMNDELQVVGNLDSGWLGRKFSLKVICDEIEEVD